MKIKLILKINSIFGKKYKMKKKDYKTIYNNIINKLKITNEKKIKTMKMLKLNKVMKMVNLIKLNLFL